VGDPAIPPIGQRLREARVERGLSVRGLARVLDVSPSLISQIEIGRSSPSVSTLYAITTALEISIEDVFGGPQTGSGGVAPFTDDALVGAEQGHDAVRAQVPVDLAETVAHLGTSVTQGLRMLANQQRVGPLVRAAGREVLYLDAGVTWELLGRLPDTHVHFLRITYAPGGSTSPAGVLMRHSGTEFGHLLSGQLTLTLGFDTYPLNPGDSVSFDCSTPHSYANHGREPAVGVWWVRERVG
jgi:transcriptional regulator with XRE-family HTH domain/quercetin dioxygenase-like cupin family protein